MPENVAPASIKLQTNNEKLNFQCKYCDKYFRFRKCLEEHEGLHTGVKPFTCNYCQKKFAYYRSCRLHLTIHAGEHPFECDVCQKKFNWHMTFRKHLEKHRNSVPTSSVQQQVDKKCIVVLTRQNHIDQMSRNNKQANCVNCSGSGTTNPSRKRPAEDDHVPGGSSRKRSSLQNFKSVVAINRPSPLVPNFRRKQLTTSPKISAEWPKVVLSNDLNIIMSNCL